MTPDTISTFLDWTQTPMGHFFLNIFLVFLVAEFLGRQIMYKIMVFVTFDKKKEAAFVELFGYLVNIIFGMFMAYKLSETGEYFLDGLWFIFGSMAMHLVYVRYLDKWIKNKVRKK